MSSTTKIYEEKMNNCVAHLDRELTSIRAGRANPGILDKVMVDYYGSRVHPWLFPRPAS